MGNTEQIAKCNYGCRGHNIHNPRGTSRRVTTEANERLGWRTVTYNYQLGLDNSIIPGKFRNLKTERNRQETEKTPSSWIVFHNSAPKSLVCFGHTASILSVDISRLNCFTRKHDRDIVPFGCVIGSALSYEQHYSPLHKRIDPLLASFLKKWTHQLGI